MMSWEISAESETHDIFIFIPEATRTPGFFFGRTLS